jgi:hypothetical protein
MKPVRGKSVRQAEVTDQRAAARVGAVAAGIVIVTKVSAGSCKNRLNAVFRLLVDGFVTRHWSLALTR